jgi:hypothetical protein
VAEAALESADPAAMDRRDGRAFTSAIRLSKVAVANCLKACGGGVQEPTPCVDRADGTTPGGSTRSWRIRGDCTLAQTVVKAALGAPNPDPAQAARAFV